jgi:hypothetical protein
LFGANILPAQELRPPSLDSILEIGVLSRVKPAVIALARLDGDDNKGVIKPRAAACSKSKVDRQYTVKPDELARCIALGAGRRARTVRLHDEALNGLLPATTWREAS